MKTRLPRSGKARISTNPRRMAKNDSPSVGSKVQFKPTRGTRMAEEIKRHANRLSDEQRSALASVAKMMINGGAHAKAPTHRT